MDSYEKKTAEFLAEIGLRLHWQFGLATLKAAVRDAKIVLPPSLYRGSPKGVRLVEVAGEAAEHIVFQFPGYIPTYKKWLLKSGLLCGR